MKYSTRLSDAAHVLALVAMSADEPLTSDAIATSIRTNPAFVRQLMSVMRKAGLVTSVRGHPRPSLARPASDISLFDIYRAVEGDKPLLHQDTHTNPECAGWGSTSSMSCVNVTTQCRSRRKRPCGQ